MEDSTRNIPGAFAFEHPAPQYVLDDDSEEEDGDYRQLWETTLQGANDDNNQRQQPNDDTPVLEATVKAAPKSLSESKHTRTLGIGCHKRSMIIVAVVVVMLVAAAVGAYFGLSSEDTNKPPVNDDPNKPPPFDIFDTNICYNSSGLIRNVLRKRKENFTQFIDIKLCHHTTIDVKYAERDDPIAGYAPPLFVQSNMRIKCGDHGSLLDECIVANGETLLLNTNYVEKEARNVTFEGITFQNGIQSLVELLNGGDITFQNCLFRVRHAG